MKKIAVLMLSSLLLMTVSATAQRVILRSSNNYDVSIDGRNYSGNNATIPNLSPGSHSIQVYQVTRGGIFGLGKRRTLVSSSGFMLRNNDVVINVDQYGQLRINQSGNTARNGNIFSRRTNGNNNDNVFNKRQRNYDDENDDNGNRSEKMKKNRGRGHKYGHDKNHQGEDD